MKNLQEALLMFSDPDVRDRYESLVGEAHCNESANLISEFAEQAGIALSRALKRQWMPKSVVLRICEDEEFGLEIGRVMLGSFKIGVAVGIEMEKPE